MLIDKLHRKGLDIATAFSSASKQRETGALQTVEPLPHPETVSTPTRRTGIKKILRPIAQFAFFLIKPAIRPIAFRLRHYLMSDILREIQELRGRMDTLLLSSEEEREQLMGTKNYVKDEVVVLGAGGHAKVCIELLQAMGKKVAYCIGDVDSADRCVGIPVLKGDENLAHLRNKGYSKLFVAVGSNELRNQLATLALKQGYQLVNAISPTAMIAPSAKLGVGIAIMAGAVINAEATIENLAIINTGATVDHDCRIGRAVHLAPQCVLAGNVVVGKYSFLGMGCTVISKIEIGERVTVGAGSVVISHIELGTTSVGVPARIIKKQMVQ